MIESMSNNYVNLFRFILSVSQSATDMADIRQLGTGNRTTSLLFTNKVSRTLGLADCSALWETRGVE